MKARRWGPADWKQLPEWAIDLESKRWIDSRRVTRTVNGPLPVMWWLMPPWKTLEVTECPR